MKIWSVKSVNKRSNTVLNLVPEQPNEVGLLIERRAQLYIRVNRDELRKALDEIDEYYPPQLPKKIEDVVKTLVGTINRSTEIGE